MEPALNIMMPENGRNSMDDVIKRAIGKESIVSISGAGGSPIQVLQLNIISSNGLNSSPNGMNSIKESVESLDINDVTQAGIRSTPQQIQTIKIPEAVVALAQAAAKSNDLTGWPLLTPYKMPLQNCNKCSQEFCSMINYRRHFRGHRMSLNSEKDSLKIRGFLGAYWDELTLDEAKEIVSFKNLALEDVNGSSIMKSLTSLVLRPGLPLLPQIYMNAGANLLDVIGGTPCRFPLSSQELFKMLDDASERTFLFGGNAMSLKKYVFNGGAGKIALEMKNLIACTSFLLEVELVKAWLAHKNGEALQNQQLLIKEEEAAQKRQAELLERKRLKKLRQKERRAKESSFGVTKANIQASSYDDGELTSSSTGARSPSPCFQSKSCLNSSGIPIRQELLLVEPMKLVEPHLDWYVKLHSLKKDVDQNVDQQKIDRESGQQHQPTASSASGQASGNPLDNIHSDRVFATMSSITLNNGHHCWCQNTKVDTGEGAKERGGAVGEHKVERDVTEKHQFLVGSILITLGHDCGHKKDGMSVRENDLNENLAKNVSGLHTASQIPQRPVDHDNERSARFETEKCIVDQHFTESSYPIPIEESCLDIGETDASFVKCNDSQTVQESGDLSVPRLFSRLSAEAFLAQRWKETMVADHVKLILTSNTGASGFIETPVDNCAAAPQ